MIDLERCQRGMNQIYVTGLPVNSMRLSLIEEAIAAIQKDPATALKDEYLGIKNYAHFGDQREDHRYGYGPKHGSIVFSIGLVGDVQPNEDAIYLLECVRDFGAVDHPLRHGQAGAVSKCNLTIFVNDYIKAKSDLELLEQVIVRATVVPVGA